MTIPTLNPEAAERVLTGSVAELSARFAGIFSGETVDRYVHESYQSLYRTAAIKHYLPVMAGRFAAERLTALAQATGKIDKTVPEVLFISSITPAGRKWPPPCFIAPHEAASTSALQARCRRARSTPP